MIVDNCEEMRRRIEELEAKVKKLEETVRWLEFILDLHKKYYPVYDDENYTYVWRPTVNGR